MVSAASWPYRARAAGERAQSSSDRQQRARAPLQHPFGHERAPDVGQRGAHQLHDFNFVLARAAAASRTTLATVRAEATASRRRSRRARCARSSRTTAFNRGSQRRSYRTSATPARCRRAWSPDCRRPHRRPGPRASAALRTRRETDCSRARSAGPARSGKSWRNRAAASSLDSRSRCAGDAALRHQIVDRPQLLRRDVVFQVDRELRRLASIGRRARCRFAFTHRKKPSTNRPAAIVSIERAAGRRPRHRLAAASREEILQRAHLGDLHDVPVIERQRAAADAANQLAVVRRDDDGRAARVDLAKQIHDLERQIRIEVAGRLVGEDDRRIVDQRAGDGDALLLAAGELQRDRRSSGAAGRPTSAPGTCAAAAASPPCRARAARTRRSRARSSLGSSLKSWKTNPSERR